ncbi:MAG: glutathione S-transferase N-terminal domain-containing protein [Pseudomonadota bacterium]
MAELTLYTSPRACSLACHIALEESGLEFESKLVRIRQGEHKTDEYLSVNPWGKIPALQIDGEVLTETHAILSYVADASEAMRLPEDALARARAHEWMNFLSSTVHIAFRPLFRPNYLLADRALHPRLLELGVPNLRSTLLEVDRRLAGRRWALGDSFSVCDPYLLVFHVWSQRDDIRPHVAEMPHWMAHRQRIEERPATWRVLGREGVTPENILLP